MAEFDDKQVFHIEEWKHGADIYRGIESLELRRIENRVLAFRSELEIKPDISEKIGHDEIPVQFTLRSRSHTALKALVELDRADVTAQVREANATTPTGIPLEFTQVIYLESTLSLSRDAKGMFSIQAVAQDVEFGTAAPITPPE
jgi:hypothetical protein